MGVHLKRWALAAGLPLFVVLLCSCTSFRAREVELEKRSESDSESYYRFTAGGGDRLSFESRTDIAMSARRRSIEAFPLRRVARLNACIFRL